MTSDFASARVADAPAGNWVDHYAPAALRPYLRLMRADRPIGTWLLLWPGLWSIALAAVATGAAMPDWRLVALFAIGAFVMRGAGCVWNDLVDRDYDAQVARTASRPIPSGQVSVRAAQVFMIALALIGFLVLIQLNWFSIALGVASLAPIAIYPFMKRVTNWPQAVLGLTFNWGALMGFAAVTGSLALAPVLLYLGCIAWTIGYDTIYAHQDKEDDATLGLKSTALHFGAATGWWVTLFYVLALGLWFASAYAAGARVTLIFGFAFLALQLAWQVATLDTKDAANCLARFRANREVGCTLFLMLVIEAGLKRLWA